MNAEQPSREQRLAEARAARDEGMQQARDHADPRVILSIDAAIEKAIASGRRFSANDIRDQFPVASQGLVGDRFTTFVKRRIDGRPLMVAVGRTASTLKSTHNHEIKVWLGYDAHQSLHRARAGASA